ncbi:MAG: Gfo/Idh/MocA family oxidoreductase [Candidatus Lokiarchaeota archaeon]|nr:Gfo/Idh/MocA family oxidoreductase [Candidatus Lokiarchaeota archaeon]
MNEKEDRPLKAILIGAGSRGMTVYGKYALNSPKKLNFIAVAEPITYRRDKFAKLHDIPPERCFKGWENIFKEDKFADIVFVCTQDQMHVEPTINALDKGYDILLEKPMAHTLEGCYKIIDRVKKTGKVLGVGHVLRYTAFFSTIKNTIREGSLGNIINISHRENVSWYHMAHSFVRGNWGNVKLSSPMILAKCCHDLDLLFWLVDALPKKISSFGSLLHFKSINAPVDSPVYCVEGCPIENICLYYAPRIYIDIVPITQILEKSERTYLKFLASLRKKHKGVLSILSKLIKLLQSLRYWRDWPVEPLYSGLPEEASEDYSDETKMRILKTSPYGRCVYKCDNDVVDHQVVNIEFENNVTANLTVHGFSENEGRTLRIDATKATLIGQFFDSGQKITVYDHFTGTSKVIFSEKLSINTSGHGGGDFSLIDSFLETLTNKEKTEPLTNANNSIESHFMAFAAEESRLKAKVVEMEKFRTKLFKSKNTNF